MQLRDTDHEKQGWWLSDHKINKIQRFTYFKPNLNNIVPWGEHWKTTEILSVLFSFPRSPLPVWQHLILTNTLSHNLKPSLQVSVMRDSLPRSIWEDSTFWIWISQWILPNTFNYSEPLTVTACQTDTVSAQIRSPDQILLINPLPPDLTISIWEIKDYICQLKQ